MEGLSPDESPQVMCNKILKPEGRNALQIMFAFLSSFKVGTKSHFIGTIREPPVPG